MNAKEFIPDDVVRKFLKEWDRCRKEGKGHYVQLHNTAGRSAGHIRSTEHALIKKYRRIYGP